MTSLPDYHIHTRFSRDSKTKMGLACEAAIARGISEIAFTDHADSIGSCFDVTLKIAQAAGFTRLATFEKRKSGWIAIGLP